MKRLYLGIFIFSIILILFGIVDFLQSSSYGAMFWICDDSNIDNTPMFYLFLNSAYTARASVCLTAQPAGRCGCTRKWEGIHPGQPTQAVETVFSCHMASCSTIKDRGTKEEGNAFGVMVLSSKESDSSD